MSDIGQTTANGVSKSMKIMNPVLAGVDAVSGLIGAADSIFGWSQKRQHKMQKELMDKQQDQWSEQQRVLADQQLEQWNRENEYNDPTNYYKRLLEGAEVNGISKASVLGHSPGGMVGQSSTGNGAPGSTSMTSTSGAPFMPMHGGSPISPSILAHQKHIAEINNIDALTDMYKAQAGKDRSQTSLNSATEAKERVLSSWYADQTLDGPYRRALMSTENALLGYQSDEVVSRSVLNFANAYEAYQRGQYVPLEFMLDLYEAESQVLLNSAIEEAYQELSKERGFNNELFQEVKEDLVESMRDDYKTADARRRSAEADASIAEKNDSFYESNRRWRIAGEVIGGAVKVGELGVGVYNARSGHNHKLNTYQLERDAFEYKKQIKQKVVQDYRVGRDGKQYLYRQTETFE